MSRVGRAHGRARQNGAVPARWRTCCAAECWVEFCLQRLSTREHSLGSPVPSRAQSTTLRSLRSDSRPEDESSRRSDTAIGGVRSRSCKARLETFMRKIAESTQPLGNTFIQIESGRWLPKIPFSINHSATPSNGRLALSAFRSRCTSTWTFNEDDYGTQSCNLVLKFITVPVCQSTKMYSPALCRPTSQMPLGVLAPHTADLPRAQRAPIQTDHTRSPSCRVRQLRRQLACLRA